MHKKRLQLLEAGPLIFHDNARPHIADIVTIKKLRDYGWEVLPHAPYSPDMSPLDSDLFPKTKEPMCGRRFSSLEELYTAVTQAIRHMNKSGVLNGIHRSLRKFLDLTALFAIEREQCHQLVGGGSPLLIS